MAFAIKTRIDDPAGPMLGWSAQKTMYGGKTIAPGDVIFLFASETKGGRGLVARGIVTAATGLPKARVADRETPRVGISVRVAAMATRPLGRIELKPFSDWKDGRPQTELNFKFYRQATDKIVGITEKTADFLDGFFDA